MGGEDLTQTEKREENSIKNDSQVKKYVICTGVVTGTLSIASLVATDIVTGPFESFIAGVAVTLLGCYGYIAIKDTA